MVEMAILEVKYLPDDMQTQGGKARGKSVVDGTKKLCLLLLYGRRNLK